MLSEKATQLLTAFVDGELTQRQRKAVMRLVGKSSEARKLLKELQENAHRLKELPKKTVQPDLVDDILKAIAQTQAQTQAPVPHGRARRRWMPYVAVSLAASIVLAIVGIVFWNALNDSNPVTPNKVFVKNDGPMKKPEGNGKAKPPVTPAVQPRNPLIDDIVMGTARSVATPIAESKTFVASFQDFRKPMVLDRFSTELRENRTVQFDVTVKNQFVAMDRLKAALSERGVLIQSDASTTKDLQAKAKREFWVYAESLTREELAQIVQDLAKADTTGMGKSVTSPYEKLTLTPLTASATQKIATLLGVEPGKLQPSKAKNPATSPKRWERSAVVLPVSPGKTQSEEIRRFLQQRRPSSDGVQVLIKLRQK